MQVLAGLFPMAGWLIPRMMTKSFGGVESAVVRQEKIQMTTLGMAYFFWELKRTENDCDHGHFHSPTTGCYGRCDHSGCYSSAGVGCLTN